MIAGLEPLDQWALELRVLRLAVWRRSGRYAEAEAELTALERDCTAAGAVSAALGAQVERAKLMYSTGNLPETQAIIRAIMVQAADGGYLYQLADAQHLLGLTYSLHKNMAQAEVELAAALALFEQLGEDARAADVRSMLGMALVGQGRNLEGIALWHEALRYFEDSGIRAAEVTLLERLGYAAWVEGDLVRTRRTLQRVLAILDTDDSLGLEMLRLMTHYNLGSVFILENKLEQALEQLATAEKLAQELADRMILFSIYLSRAQVAVLRGRPGDARILRSAALACAAEVKLDLNPSDACQLAVITVECEGAAAGESCWPSLTTAVKDAGMRMLLRATRSFVCAVRERTVDPERAALYERWTRDLDNWLGEN